MSEFSAQDAPSPVDAPRPLSQPRRLKTPERERLLSAFAENERQSKMWLAAELIAILVGTFWWLDQQTTGADNLIPGWQFLLLFGFGFLGLFDFVLGVWMSNRKPLERVRADAKFGEHTRDSLLAATRRVQDRLGLAGKPVKVFLAREKDVNAFALRLELLPGWHLFNHVQLNRSIVHLLNEKELESVIGHELGHVYPYSPIASRCLLVHALLGGVLSLVIAHLLRNYDIYVGAPLLGIGIARWVAFSTWTSQVRLVEFLCDDHGARAAGLVPAMTCELKMGVEQEARSALLLRVLEAKQKHADIPIKDLMESYEEALPFGGVEEETARKQMEQNLRKRLAEDEGTSFKGLFNYVFKSDDTDDDALEDTIQKMRRIRRVAKLPIPTAQLLRQSAPPTLEDLGSLVGIIEYRPDHVLMHLPEEVDDRGSTHPNVSRRLLYLWRNRAQYPVST